MPVTVVLGCLWGDEGKGRMCHALASDFDVACRFNAGRNAAHTVIHDQRKWVMHQVPAAVFHPHVRCVLGAGMAIDPLALLEEMDALAQAGIDTSRISVSAYAQCVLPYHREQAAAREEKLAYDFLGTTGHGVGFAYADRGARTGLQLKDLFAPSLRQRIEHHLDEKHGSTDGADHLTTELARAADRLAAHIIDAEAFLRRVLADGQNILAEGAQGALLDVVHGTYPYSTSSHSTVGGAISGLGVPASAITRVIGVTRGFATRESRGPFPTEVPVAEEQQFRLATREYALRVGWLDSVALRNAIEINGIDALAVTHLDSIGRVERIHFCSAYRLAGELLPSFPRDPDLLDQVECDYLELPGWPDDISGAISYNRLPGEARAVVDVIEDLSGTPVEWISTRRDDTVIMRA